MDESELDCSPSTTTDTTTAPAIHQINIVDSDEKAPDGNERTISAQLHKNSQLHHPDIKRGVAYHEVRELRTTSVEMKPLLSSSFPREGVVPSASFSGEGGGTSPRTPIVRKSSDGVGADIIVEKRGVKILLLKRILALCNGRAAPYERIKEGLWVDNGWSISAVTNAIIGAHELEKPYGECRWSISSDGASKLLEDDTLTCNQDGKFSLIDYLEEYHSTGSGTPHPALGVTYNDVVGEQANLFVSLSYSGNFSDLVEAVEIYMEDNCLDENETYLWYDPIVNNQWDAANKNVKEWCFTFKQAIKDIKHTVAILTPWNDPHYIQRLWCLMEFASTIQSGQRLGIGMSRTQKELFIDGFLNDFDSVYVPYQKIKAVEASCFEEKDKVAIKTYIENTTGYKAIETCVFANIRSWMLSTMERHLQKQMDMSCEKALRLQFTVSRLYSLQADYAIAVERSKSCFENYKDVFGTSHEGTLTSMCFYAECCSDNSDSTAAIEISNECLQMQRDLLGGNHRSTLTTFSNLSWYYSEKGDYDVAISIGKECLEIRQQKLGLLDVDTLSSLHRVAAYYNGKCDYKMAIEKGTDCLNKRNQVLGELHKDTLSSLNNLANYHTKAGNYETAMKLGYECLEKKERVLGHTHPDTLETLTNLATIYYEKGDFDNAVTIGNECLDKMSTALGEMHSKTIMAQNNLSCYYRRKGYYETATLLSRDCLEKMKEVHKKQHKDEPMHKDILTTLFNLVQSSYEKGDFKTSLQLGSECLAKQKDRLGEHSESIATSNALALVHFDQGHFEVAEGMLEDALAAGTRIIGPNNPSTLATMQYLALVLFETGKLDRAEELFGKVSECYTSKETPNEAINYLETVLKIRSRILDQRDPLTLKTFNYLAILKEKIYKKK